MRGRILSCTTRALRRCAHPLAFAVLAAVLAGALGPARAGAAADPHLPLDIRIATDEADAALAILAELGKGRAPAERDWARLFASEGWRRLRERETSMGRPFDEAGMRAFLTADSTRARAASLAATLADWKRVQVLAAARRAFLYLPEGTPIRATVHLVIKPRANSFVFDLTGDPAIFLAVDPEVPPARLANTIAHELHHIGLGRACADAGDSTEAPARREVRRWAGAFGEGVAVLAASGGALVHPDLTWSRADQTEWKRDMRDARHAMTRLERFFVSLDEGTLADPDSIRATAMEFFGNRGPWYTVGYQMANAVERAFGRERLVATLCDMRELVVAYQAAVPLVAARYGAELPRWSDGMIAAMRRSPPAHE